MTCPLADRARRLAAALRKSTSRSLEELREHFLPVHAALAEGSLPDEAWNELSALLPSIGWWRSWDRCERLRRAAITAVARRDGCLGALLRDADAATVRYMVRSCLATADGNALLSRLILKEDKR